MARPQKAGLSYFPLDVDFFEDEKIQLISAEFGIKAEPLILRLLCKIYKNGYYYQWGDDQCLLMVKSIGVGDCSKRWVEEVIKGLVRRCFFDKKCFDSSKILTSTAIQSRYITAITKRVLKTDNMPFWLLSSQSTPETPVNPEETPINPTETLVNPTETQHIKLNEMKVNKSKLKETISKEEQREMLEIFFFKRYAKRPQLEKARFLNHYSSTNWLNANGHLITDKVACCGNWKIAKDSELMVVDFVTKWESVYKVHKNDILLTDVYNAKMNDGKLTIYCTKEFALYLEENLTTYKQALTESFEITNGISYMKI